MAIAASVNGGIAGGDLFVHYTGLASATLSVPSGAVGLAVVAWSSPNATSPSSITDSSGNVWTRVLLGTSPLTSGGNPIKVAVYKSPIFPAADATWAMAFVDASGSNFNLDFTCCAVQFWTGFPAGSAAVDVAAWSASIPTAAFTTTNAAELVVCIPHSYNVNIGPDTGFTESYDNNRLAFHWKEVSAILTGSTVAPTNCSAAAVVTLTAGSAAPVIASPTKLLLGVG